MSGTTMKNNPSNADVVRFWRTVEMFSPQAVPKPNSSNEHIPVFSVKPGVKLPWEPEHPLANRTLPKDHIWQHTVYVGVYEIKQVFESLQQVFEPDLESFDARLSGQSALAALKVSSDGRLIGGSEVLSMCAWGIGRTQDPGPTAPGWLDGFEHASGMFVDSLTEIVAGFQEPSVNLPSDEPSCIPSGRPITVTELEKCLESLVELLGVQDLLACSEIRIASHQIKAKDANKIGGSDFLNSFFVSDLGRVATHIEKGNIGAGLSAYLLEDRQIDKDKRVDVRKSLDAVYDLVNPARTPLGRWPSPPDHPLALSQQLAVNAITGSLKENSGLFSVNGPPGTGKTTMLRDLVAAIVVERGCALASLAKPEDAFNGSVQWKAGDYTRTVQRWAPELTGFEIVVASSNNGAVQNVTDEIPAMGAVSEENFPSLEVLDYFPELATELLNVDQKNSQDNDLEGNDVRRAWALAAGRLGNKQNRSQFANALWFGGEAGKQNRTQNDEQHPLPLGIQSIFKRMETERRSLNKNSWDEAKADFVKARDYASSLLAERAKTHTDYLEISRATAERDEVRRDIETTEQTVSEISHQLTVRQSEVVALRQQNTIATDKYRLQLELKPGLLEIFFTFGKRMRAWSTITSEYQNELRYSEQALADAQQAEQISSQKLSQATENLSAYRARIIKLDELLAELDDAQVAARQRWGNLAVDPTWCWDDARREVQSLWLDSECNTARSEVFIAALRLHKAFLAHVPTQMRKSLHGAMDILKGEAPADIDQDAALAAWQSLFFLVPVVSTTFASFDRVFSHLGRESIAWLFIDEAGQAAPQQAVGAIWRSKRTIAVGDPLQLEPVVTIPFKAQQAIRINHGVTETWLPARSSVQVVTDRITQLGTSAGSGEDQTWVGAPLRVHRRCDEPMFGIINSVVYGGLMVNGNPDRGRYPTDINRREVPPSAWIDVIGSDAKGHWIPEEQRVLIKILDRLHEEGQDLHEVFVITPFRDVAQHLHDLRKPYRGSIRYGTIHTAQGKEADIVFLVLGGNPLNPGAKTWAASKPNLMNVAVSRAKRRLYVIGNHTTWTSNQYFDTLASSLPVSKDLYGAIC